MKRNVLAAAVLLLLAATTLSAATPPAIWFQDNFDSYATGKLALNGVGKWGGAQVVEPGMGAPFGDGTSDVNINTGGQGACLLSTPNFVQMTSYQRNWNTEGNLFYSNPKGIAAETLRPPANNPGVAWDAQSVDQVQILSFKMKEAYPDNPAPPLHAGIYLIDNDMFNPQPIMGWVMSCKMIRPQLTLPTNMAPNWTTSRYFVPTEGGGGYPLPQDSNCHEFTSVYDPATGVVKFYVDAISLTTPLWTGNAGTGRASRSLYIRDYGFSFGDGDNAVDVTYFDDVAVGTTARPVLTAPLGGVFLNTTTPTVTWNHAFVTPLPTKYRVRVCSADDSSGPIVYDSGELAGSATSKVTNALPTNTHLWAFVNELNGVWTGYSLVGNGGFYIVTAAPTTPTVTSPSGAVVGAKPSVIFSDGVLHNQFDVKITTTIDGSGTPVWSVSVPNSLKNGASCSVMLTPGTQYYAFAKAGNPIGSSAWSAASPFTVTRTGEGTDIRNMEETWDSSAIWEHSAAAPDDGFYDYIGGGMGWIEMRVRTLPDPFNRFPALNGLANGQPCDWWPGGGGMLRDQPGSYIIPPIPDRAAPSTILDFWDTGSGWSDNCIMRHQVSNIDLDKGVTLVTYAAGKCYEGANCGSHNARKLAEEAQIYVMDNYGTGQCMASFRYGQGEVGICTNASSWLTGGYTDNQVEDRPGQGWHTVRITGRNAVVGDYTTTVWKYYLDENPTPILTATGSMDQSIAPAGGIVDAIAIGQGDGGLVGNWQYDWTGVNTAGDYAPGEWFIGGTFATVSAAKGASGPIVITGDAVITGIDRVGTDLRGFSVQDVGTQDHAGLYVVSSSTDENIAVGHIVRGIGGMMSMETGVGATLQGGFTATTEIADAPPLAMPQKSLHGYGHVAAGLANGGMFVRAFGRVTQVGMNLSGVPVVYIEDGSGLLDGRSGIGNDSSALGLRIVILDSFEAGIFTPSVGDYCRVDGICTCETWTEGATTKTVETLLAPRFTIVPEP